MDKTTQLIDLYHNLIQKNLAEGQTTVEHVPVADQKAYMFTNTLRRVEFEK